MSNSDHIIAVVQMTRTPASWLEVLTTSVRARTPAVVTEIPGDSPEPPEHPRWTGGKYWRNTSATTTSTASGFILGLAGTQRPTEETSAW